MLTSSSLFIFFFSHPATTELYTLSLHDALPISLGPRIPILAALFCLPAAFVLSLMRSEEHTSELQSRRELVCRPLLEKKNLQATYANLHTDQERDYFLQRYHDVISSFGGQTSYDADNRPLLVMRSNLWASGYDVDGTDQTSLGQFSGRVQQTYKHSVPRFFVPEHGTMFTLALVRFPPTATKEIQYLNAKGALTYTD